MSRTASDALGDVLLADMLADTCESSHLLVFVSMNKSETQCQLFNVGRNVASHERVCGGPAYLLARGLWLSAERKAERPTNFRVS